MAELDLEVIKAELAEGYLVPAEDVLALIAEVERLRAAVALHRESMWGDCGNCRFVWPCPTARAASGEAS